MERLYKKAEEYLQGNFPGKLIKRYSKIRGDGIEVWGINGLMLLVSEGPVEVSYQLVTLKEQLSKK